MVKRCKQCTNTARYPSIDDRSKQMRRSWSKELKLMKCLLSLVDLFLSSLSYSIFICLLSTISRTRIVSLSGNGSNIPNKLIPHHSGFMLVTIVFVVRESVDLHRFQHQNKFYSLIPFVLIRRERKKTIQKNAKKKRRKWIKHESKRMVIFCWIETALAFDRQWLHTIQLKWETNTVR